MTGEFSSPINFGTTTLINADNRDLFIVKYNTSGNALWSVGAGGIGYDQGNCISFDTSDNVYLSGVFASDSISFGASTLYNEGTNFDIFVAKFGSQGNVIWAKGAGSPGIDHGLSAIDNFGNIYVGGWFRYANFMNFGTTTLLNTDSTGNLETMFVAKLGDISIGFKEQINLSEFNIYPNPSNGIFTISSKDFGLKICSVYNILGENIYTQSFNTTKLITIDLSSKVKGIYFLEIIDENNHRINKKIIIE